MQGSVTPQVAQETHREQAWGQQIGTSKLPQARPMIGCQGRAGLGQVSCQSNEEEGI